MANILTSLRILCGILIFFVPTFSKGFYIIYLFGGFTDGIDGTVARKLGKETEFGAKLDTVADIVFVLSTLIKVITALYFPVQIIFWIAVIFLIKIAGIIAGYIKHKRFVPVHSILNKITGVIAFLIPLFIGRDYSWQAKLLVIVITCILATISAIQEFIKILKFQE